MFGLVTMGMYCFEVATSKIAVHAYNGFGCHLKQANCLAACEKVKALSCIGFME